MALGAISDSLWTHLDDSTAVLWIAISDTCWIVRQAINDSLWAHLDDSTSVLWTALTDTAWMVLDAIHDTMFANTPGYLTSVASQSITKTHIDSTSSNLVFNDAYRITSQQGDSMFMTKAYIDATAGGLVNQSVKGDHVDSTSEDFVFNDAFRITSQYDDSMLMTKAYIDAAAGGLQDQSVKGNHVDSTSEDFVFNDAYHITSAEADSEYITHGGVSSTYETIANVGLIGDDTTNWNTAYGWGDHSAEIHDTLNVHWDEWLHVGGDIGTGVFDFGGATSLEIPNSANPTTDAKGEIAWDTDDRGFEVYDSVSASSVIISALDDKEATVANPTGLEFTAMPFFHVSADKYPHGIGLVSLTFGQSAAGSDTFVLHEYSTDTTWASTIDSVVTTARQHKETTITDANIAGNAWIFVEIANRELDWMTVKVIFYIKEGD